MACLGVIECGTATTGLWCAACGLPSGAETTVWWITDDGLHSLGRYRVCLECGRPEGVDAAAAP